MSPPNRRSTHATLSRGVIASTGALFLVVILMSSAWFSSCASRVAAADLDSTVIIDNGDPGTSSTGNWKRSRKGAPYGGDADYTRKSATYTFAPGLEPGSYRVYLTWPDVSRLSAEVSVLVHTAGGVDERVISQRRGGGQWNLIGEFELSSTSQLQLTLVGRGILCADAARFEAVDSVPTPMPPAPPPPLLPPQGLLATAAAGAIVLQWQDRDMADLAGYSIYRDPPDGSGTPRIAAGVTSSTFTDTDVVEGVMYSYTLTAVDLDGTESERSDVVSAYPLDIPPPAPVGLKASAEQAVIHLSWDPVDVPDLAGYAVYRAEGLSGDLVLLVDVMTATSYSDFEVSEGVTCIYVVTSYDTASNESVASTEVVATPTVARAPARGAVTVAWDPPKLNDDGTALDDLAGYLMYWGRGSGQYDNVLDVGNVTTVTLKDLPIDEEMFVSVTAYDESGNESRHSVEISVMAE